MLVNLPANDRDQILTILRESQYIFYLTGSRYFGTPHADSDYDFFIADEPGIQKFLLLHGFQRITRKKGTNVLDNDYVYQDNNLIAVYRSPHGIDIQIQKDIYLKIKAQALMKFAWFHFSETQRCDKRNMRFLWNTAYLVVKHSNL